MGVYPARFGDPGAHERSCQQTISRLARLPHAQDWQTMARGTICVYGSGGLDSRTVVVTYKQRGIRATAVGSVQSNLGPGFRVMVPPTPARAEIAASSPPRGSARCSPATF
jgi:asparagine synthetase B (glutamine-hydrolysing)